jgi:bifunctional non-homologous end joining protein LigD
MSLDKYYEKRDLTKSPEPKGDIKMLDKEEIKEDIKQNVGPIFVVQEHDASHLHWDFRLEIGGVLRSWAIPKGVPEEINIRRLAIQTEDHPIEYADFEGIIPEGMYGAGTVKIWDKGVFALEEETNKKLVFFLQGKRLSGKYALIKIMMRGKESWLLFKTMEF